MSEHWDDTICYANYLLIAMFVQMCVTRWNDKKKALERQEKGLLG
ncbi:MAG: hypothetical protein ACR5K3_00235 [Wolbachia sp.]